MKRSDTLSFFSAISFIVAFIKIAFVCTISYACRVIRDFPTRQVYAQPFIFQVQIKGIDLGALHA